jgi:hypothetical protein
MPALGQIELDDEVAAIVAPNTTRLSGVSDDAELAWKHAWPFASVSESFPRCECVSAIFFFRASSTEE